MFLIDYFRKRKIKKETLAFERSGVLREFIYSYGNMAEGMTSYLLKDEGDSLSFIFLKTSMRDGEEIRSDMELPLSQAQQFKGLIRENQLYLWNGFNKSSSVIATGNSFTLKAVFDNYTLKASGMVMLPEDYEKKHQALSAFLKGIVRENYTDIS